ncbi:MAG: hypothetical protein ACE5F2_00665 [Candidatus Paceibacteria bacterium]
MFNVPNLTRILDIFGIPIEKFGSGKFKRLQDLFDEIKDEDCQIVITGGKIYRTVSVIRAKVLYKNLILKEYLQTFDDDRENSPRDRLHVSEKIHIGELARDALKRGFEEELQITSEIDFEEKGVVVEDTNPKTRYPGPKSIYTFYDFTVVLTEDQYVSEGYVEYGKKTGITTYFKWVQNLEKL